MIALDVLEITVNWLLANPIESMIIFFVVMIIVIYSHALSNSNYIR